MLCPYSPGSDPSLLWWHQAKGHWSITYQWKNADGVMLNSHEQIGEFATDTEAQSECEKRNMADMDRFYTTIPVLEGDRN